MTGLGGGAGRGARWRQQVDGLAQRLQVFLAQRTGQVGQCDEAVATFDAGKQVAALAVLVEDTAGLQEGD